MLLTSTVLVYTANKSSFLNKYFGFFFSYKSYIFMQNCDRNKHYSGMVQAKGFCTRY